MPIDAASNADLRMRVIREIEGGIPLEPHPYRVIGERLEVSESDVLEVIRHLAGEGAIRRYGIVVRHHELGFRANGMVVWDVPDNRVDEIGRLFGEQRFVTLCYQRPRKLPDWRYNLFTMVHGCEKNAVRENVRVLENLLEGPGFPHEILFSARRFKQRGARYAVAPRLESVTVRGARETPRSEMP